MTIIRCGEIQGSSHAFQRYCDRCFHIYSVLKWCQYSFSSYATCVICLGMLVAYHVQCDVIWNGIGCENTLQSVCLQEVGCEFLFWIDLAQDNRFQWQGFVTIGWNWHDLLVKDFASWILSMASVWMCGSMFPYDVGIRPHMLV
jgi:hypothetical protein